jgi:hypothetical protein
MSRLADVRDETAERLRIILASQAAGSGAKGGSLKAKAVRYAQPIYDCDNFFIFFECCNLLCEKFDALQAPPSTSCNDADSPKTMPEAP